MSVARRLGIQYVRSGESTRSTGEGREGQSGKRRSHEMRRRPVRLRVSSMCLVEAAEASLASELEARRSFSLGPQGGILPKAYNHW